MGAYVLVCWCRGALSSTRPPWMAVRSSVDYGEPKTLHQAEPGTTSSARFISTSDADKPYQKCVKARSRLLSSELPEDLPLWA